MARERNEKAYTFYAVEVLKGAFDGIDFNAFLHSPGRRMLRQTPEDVVLFVKWRAESDWQYLAYADPEYQKFIRAIIRHSSRWEEFKGSKHRIEFFAGHLNHSDPKIRTQAYLEVARAPYASIKSIAGTVPRERIRDFLDSWRFIEWHSLFILMLGQSQHPDDKAFIRQQLEFAAASNFKRNLSAWVVAYIETNPKTGLEKIEKLYFNDKNRTPSELKEVFKGLSVLGSETGFPINTVLYERRERIIESYRTLIRNHPKMSGTVAKNLTNWRIRALVGPLTQISKNEPDLDPNSKLAINYYLSISQRFPPVKTSQ